MLRIRVVPVLWIWALLFFGASSSFSATSLAFANGPSPPPLDSLRVRYVHTGKVGYVSVQLERQVSPLVARTTHFSFGSGKPENQEISYPPYSEAFFIAVGRGIRRYLQDAAPGGMSLEACLAIAYVSVSFDKSGTDRPSEVDISGAIYGAVGYSWLLLHGWGLELLAGVMWPSLYPRPGIIHSLEPDFFAGLSVSSAF
ncbi:hypothetical protein E3J95_01660 [Candidatus Aerophobetes bacterium]|uniref:DUF3575 domain-containing protein n=1 Tax=Aerophobetes bacterium TaxID=2030807 RepID=A0A523QLA5_UNCAE|nr:MAG: hypothetical protein E3J95_01660 [Candidatus Aerophobetes bacterium]